MFKINSKGKIEIDFNLKLAIFLFGLLLLGTLTSAFFWIQTNTYLGKEIDSQKPARLKVTIIKAESCKECYDVKPFLDALKKENVEIVSEKTLEVKSAGARYLIRKFNIEKAPILIITGQINKFPSLEKLWQGLGEIKGRTFVQRKIGAPYFVVASGQIIGKASLTMLKDSNCKKCYEVEEHENILQGFGIYLENKNTTESSSAEGKNLINKYNIRLLPTIILTGEIDAYEGFKSVWLGVGTIENDGTYVFREGVKQMGTYKDLESGRTITPEKSN